MPAALAVWKGRNFYHLVLNKWCPHMYIYIYVYVFSSISINFPICFFILCGLQNLQAAMHKTQNLFTALALNFCNYFKKAI